MSPQMTPIADLVEQAAPRDNQVVFDQLWAITVGLFERVQGRFALSQDPCSHDLQDYKGENGAAGRLSAYCGPDIDWLIHAWTGNPTQGFTNIHLSIYLGSHIDVPHFALALGTMPELFFYLDYLPRKELLTHPDYADLYWGGQTNAAFFQLQQNSQFQPFLSRDVYTRAALSPTAICCTAPISQQNIDAIILASHAALDRWLAWVESAPVVREGDRSALADRDRFIRRTICERDPANAIAVRLFGQELTDRLVATLWGSTRRL